MNKTCLILLWGLLVLGIYISFPAGISTQGIPENSKTLFPSFDSYIGQSEGLDTYDARDKFNRPVSSLEARQQLKALFSSGLYNLLVCSETHYSAGLLATLRKMFSSAAGFLTRNVREICMRYIPALLPQIRKFFISVALIVFVTLQFFSTFQVSSHLFFTPRSKAAPLVLRC